MFRLGGLGRAGVVLWFLFLLCYVSSLGLGCLLRLLVGVRCVIYILLFCFGGCTFHFRLWALGVALFHVLM